MECLVKLLGELTVLLGLFGMEPLVHHLLFIVLLDQHGMVMDVLPQQFNVLLELFGMG
jgi:hypothetical protein